MKSSTLADVAGILPETSWVWEKWLPRGYATGIVSNAGEGKSLIALDAGAHILEQRDWPDGSSCDCKENIIIADTESSQGLLVERAQKWKLPLKRILMPLENPLDDFRLNDPKHFENLVNLAHLEKPGLIIIDSLRGAYSGNENSSELHQALGKLANLARDLNTAILIVHHIRKANIYEQQAGSKVTLERVRGSSAIVQLTRVLWAIDQPDPNSEIKRLAVIKSNLSRKPLPLGFRITDEGVLWTPAPMEPRRETETMKAEDFLLDALKKCSLPAARLYEEADQIGLSSSSIKRAKGRLKIVSLRENGKWVWSLPLEPTPLQLVNS